MSFYRLPRNPQSAFFSQVHPSPGEVVNADEAAALLERFLADGSQLDLYALAGLLAAGSGREAEAYEAVERFVQSVMEFVPEGSSVAPGELDYNVLVSQVSREAVPASAPTPARVKRDLSEQVTVFVTTVGYPTFERAMECLGAQDCRFQLKVIENVAPMSAAFQRMLDECDTPFYVQVDEDMLVSPHAVRTLYERICELDDDVAMFAGCLFDEHMNRAIYGVKIFRMEIVRRYPMRDVEGFELEQRSRWRRDGYTDYFDRIEGAGRNTPQTLGLHGTHWTPPTVYLRYFVLEVTRRKGTKSHEWVPQEAAQLLKRFLVNRTEIDLYALGGILAGQLQNRLGMGRSKHSGRYHQTPGFQPFRRFVAALERTRDELDSSVLRMPLVDRLGR